MNGQGPQDVSPAFERDKWEVEQRRLDRELELREKELAFKIQEARRSRWWNPLAIAIFGAAIAAGGSAYVSRENNRGSLQLETLKAESARIFEVVKTGNPDLAAKNLSFLLDTGLIQSAATANNIRDYLSKRKQGEGVTLPPEQPPSIRQGAIRERQFLASADLHDRDLSGADLTGATLAGANLTNADLSGAILAHANLVNARLSGANLTNADLDSASVLGADLTNADLSGARNLKVVQLEKACGQPRALPANLPARFILLPCR